MASTDHREQRFASFVLESGQSIELAIHAEKVLEATPVTGPIQPLPGAMPYLEGFMHLRDDAIPVVNMKKRLGLPLTDYGIDAKVAVVTVAQVQLGLLFDDIRDVFVVHSDAIAPVHRAFRTEAGIIANLIKLDKGRRTMELLDLNRLLESDDEVAQVKVAEADKKPEKSSVHQTYSRFVVFHAVGQDYGVPVEQVQEITFLSEIDDVFKNDAIEGAIQLRGHTIPVIDATGLLQSRTVAHVSGDDTRVLVLNADTFQYGLIVDSIREILSIPDQAILTLPCKGNDTVTGIYPRPNGRNIMLVRVDTLIDAQHRELRSVARLKSATHDRRLDDEAAQSRHLITADCYLVFSIGRTFAIELNDVQEIIDAKDLMALPAAEGFDRRVLNLRGTVVPVINLNAFYGYAAEDDTQEKKLIVARNQGRIIALEVDRILTICKQVQFKKTPSLNPQLADKKDTLDRLIEFVGETGIKEHVLVVNIETMMDNHLHMTPGINTSNENTEIKEHTHGNHGTTQQAE